MNKNIKLSDRLEAVIAAVALSESAADIGTDHGYVPVELVRRGTVKRALAMDVRPGPLARAREHIDAAGLGDRIETRLSDGLEKLAAGEAETVVIAGMGGGLMVRILEDGRHMWDSVRQWVLSPHSEIEKVRGWMAENGFVSASEHMVYEDGKYYTVLSVQRNGDAAGACGADGRPVHARAGTARDLIYGRLMAETRDPVFFQYLKDEERKLTELCAALAAQAETSGRAASRLESVKERLLLNREVQDEMQ